MMCITYTLILQVSEIVTKSYFYFLFSTSTASVMNTYSVRILIILWILYRNFNYPWTCEPIDYINSKMFGLSAFIFEKRNLCI